MEKSYFTKSSRPTKQAGDRPSKKYRFRESSRPSKPARGLEQISNCATQHRGSHAQPANYKMCICKSIFTRTSSPTKQASDRLSKNRSTASAHNKQNGSPATKIPTLRISAARPSRPVTGPEQIQLGKTPPDPDILNMLKFLNSPSKETSLGGVRDL